MISFYCYILCVVCVCDEAMTGFPTQPKQGEIPPYQNNDLIIFSRQGKNNLNQYIVCCCSRDVPARRGGCGRGGV